MEGTAFVGKRSTVVFADLVANAERAEVFGRSGDDIGEKFANNAT
jgi:hypothetical protein